MLWWRRHGMSWYVKHALQLAAAFFYGQFSCSVPILKKRVDQKSKTWHPAYFSHNGQKNGPGCMSLTKRFNCTKL